jgi:hypothetical protein
MAHEEGKLNRTPDSMNYNLNMLRQTYCRPAKLTANAMPALFPLERGCEQGRILSGKAPKAVLQLMEFDPCGLEQTYRDKATGAELPAFAVFNLEGDHRCVFEIALDSVPTAADPSSLQAHLPFKRTQRFVRKINQRSIMIERLVAFVCGTLGSIAAVVAIVLETIGAIPAFSPFAVLAGAAVGALFAYMLIVAVIDLFVPRIRLVITAEFNGILPRETRAKARAAKQQFDNLYLIVDQQGRWEAKLLPDPMPRELDPLLVGELNAKSGRKYFLIDQFDLTGAEQYLIDEFALRTNLELS